MMVPILIHYHFLVLKTYSSAVRKTLENKKKYEIKNIFLSFFFVHSFYTINFPNSLTFHSDFNILK